MHARIRSIALAITLILLSAGAAEAKKKAGGWIKRRNAKGRMVLVDIKVPALLASGKPNVQAKASVVIDLDSGALLYEKAGDDRRPIASISKMFAAMVVMDRKLDLEAVTVVTDEDARVARGGAKSRLYTGRAYQNIDLLHAMMMGSDNRAVSALGRATGLGVPELVSAMNAKALELGLRHTGFGDPTGLSNDNQSTARELVLAVRAMLTYPLLREISAKKEYDVHTADDKPGQIATYVNTDQIARAGRYQVYAGKTGYTDEARYCLVIAAKVGERKVAAAFLSAEGELTRFADFNRTAQWLLDDGPAKVAAKAVLAVKKSHERAQSAAKAVAGGGGGNSSAAASAASNN